MFRAHLLAPLLLALTTACATAPHGPTPLARRASFDLNCPVDRLTAVDIDTNTVGIRGCGKRTVYIAACGGFQNCRWLRQGEVQEDGSRQTDDPPPRQ